MSTNLEQELQERAFDGVLRCSEHNIYQSVWDTFHRPNKRERLLRICERCHTPMCLTCVRFVRKKPYCQACAKRLEAER